MNLLFPESVKKLPMADVPLDGLSAYLMQGPSQQLLFMRFDKDVVLEEHKHASQFGLVLEGRIDLCIDGISHTFYKGDHYYIPKNVAHSGKIYAGYADITFFDERDRYQIK